MNKIVFNKTNLKIQVDFNPEQDEFHIFVQDMLFMKMTGYQIPFTYLSQIYSTPKSYLWNDEDGEKIVDFMDRVKNERVLLGLNKQPWPMAA